MSEEKQYYVYIITNRYNTILYTGVTNNLERRIAEHKGKVHRGFSSKYNANKLVFYESTSDVHIALEREKQIKGWVRKKKRDMITKYNPRWNDLAQESFN